MKWIAICNTIMCRSEIYSQEEDAAAAKDTNPLDIEWANMIFNKLGYSNEEEMRNTHVVLQTLYVEMKKQLVLIGVDDCNLNLLLKLSGTKEQYSSKSKKKEDTEPDAADAADAADADAEEDAQKEEEEEVAGADNGNGNIADKVKNTQIIIANQCKNNIKAIEKLSEIYDNKVNYDEKKYRIAHKFNVRDEIHIQNLEEMKKIIYERYDVPLDLQNTD